MAESTEGRLNTLPALALEGLPLPEGGNAPLNLNNDSNVILVQNTITKRVDYTTVESIVSRGGGGGGSQDLQSVTSEGNVTGTPLIVTNGTTAISHNADGIGFSGAGDEVNLLFNPASEGGNLKLPLIQPGDDKTLVSSVNNVNPDEWGNVVLGLPDILNVYAEDENDAGTQFLGLNVESNMYMSNSNGGGGLNYLGTSGGNAVTIYSSSSALNRQTGLFAKEGQLIIQTATEDGTGIFGGFVYDQDRTASMNTDRHIPDIGKVNELIADAGIGGGTVTSVTGLDGVNVATGTTTPVISLGDITPDSVRSLVQISNNANSNFANLISNNLTSSKTIFLPNSPDNSVLATGVSVNGGAAVYADTTGVIPITVAAGAPLNSPAFTGNPTAPTPAAGDNDTSIATTAWVTSYFDPIHTSAGYPYYDGVGGRTMVTGASSSVVLANGTTGTIDGVVRGATLGTVSPVNTAISAGITITTFANRTQGQINALTAYTSKTANYTLTALDYCVDLTANSATFTLPTAVGIAGKQYVVKNSASGTTLTLATTSSQTIDGTTTKTFNTQYSGARVISDGANWKIIATF